ncbi:hypothetical protein BKI52_43680 [marine bacterium AO1-C]|nr:hypothetical protein BKI52_43680 [marine bacterium AO1-C]
MKNFTEYQVSRHQIKNIIFDLGGVVINIDWQLTVAAFQKLAKPEFKAQNEDLIQKGTYKAQFFIDYEIGSINDATFCQHLRDTFHLDANDAQISEAWNALLMDVPANRIELINNLRNTHRTFVLSNTNAIHIEEANNILHKAHGVTTYDDLVEKAYYSHLMNKRKPWPEIYQQIIDENELNPAETLFIDDNVENIQAANSVGLQGLHVVPNLNGSVQFFNEILV